jgi:predicted lactoylglutathione lyase
MSFVVRMRVAHPHHVTMENVMNKQIILNIPVKNLDKSKAFFAALDYGFNPDFASEHSACVVIADGSIYAMLSAEAVFKTCIDKPVVQAKEANELVICLSCESREELESLIAKAQAAGGRIPHPLEDHGFMVDQGFEDIDGHLWNLVWMAPKT